MGLLDNLFKPKPDTGTETIADGPPGGESAAGEQPACTSGTTPRPSQFLAPKTYIPRSSAQVVPPTRGHAPVPPRPTPETAPEGPKEIVLTLGDVLSRIPSHFLRQGLHDARRELRFPAADLAADIARGRASVFLADIVAQCPDVFLPEAQGFDDIQIRLPLQKLVEQIVMTSAPRPAPSPKAAPKPAAPPTPDPAPKPPEQPASFSPETRPAAPVITPPISFPKAAPSSAGPAVAPAREEEIHLSLAAILKRCPPEIIIRPLPPVDDTVRITFPFPPIERQLAAGKVEVSSLRFIAALPLALMKCFEAKAGVKVPLPLEEIFQNLPDQTPPVETPPPQPAAPPEPVAEPAVSVKAEEVATAPATPVAEPVLAAVPEILPEPVVARQDAPEPSPPAMPEPKIAMPEAGEVKAEAPQPAASPVEAPPPADPAPSAAALSEPAPFRAFAPTLRPPVLLRPEHPSVTPETHPAQPPPPEFPQTPPAQPVDNVPEPVAAPEPAIEPPRPVAPVPPAAFQPPMEPAPPPPALDPVTPPPSPIQPPAAEPEPMPQAEDPTAAGDPPRIGPPQFRPVVVLPPPIFFTPTKTEPPAPPAEAAVPVEPAKIEEPPVEVPAPISDEAPPAIVEEPLAKEPAPLASETASPAPATEELAAAIEPPAPAPVAVEPMIEEAPIADAPTPEPTPIAEPPPPAAPILLDGEVAALFASESPLDLPRVGQLLAALPGIHACVIATRHSVTQGGELPSGLDAQAIRQLGQRLHSAIARLPQALKASEVRHLTLHGERFSLSLFTQGDACVCAVHRARIFLPGVREKFAAVADELARLAGGD